MLNLSPFIEHYFTDQEKILFVGLKSEKDYKLFMRAHFEDNFASFVNLLGYKDTGKFHIEQLKKIAEVKKLEDSPVRRLWLWSRGFFKTSLITEAHTLWLIVNNPNIRILVVSFSLDVAKKPLAAIRNHLMFNNNFRYFFPEFCPKANTEGKIEFGTTEAFTIPCRTKNLKEPTVMCAGVGTNITGLHFDFQKIDDLVNKDTVTNDTQIQTSKDYFSLLGPIFDNPTCPRQDVIGTIYHFNDLHSVILKNNKFSSSIIPVHDSNYNFIFPERISKEAFEKEILNDPSNNPYDIQSQYLLNPINPADAKFKDEWFKYYEDAPDGMAEYICVDPASTQKKKSDYTVIQRWGVDSEGHHYFLEGIRDKLTVFERIDKLFLMVKHSKNLKYVRYEVLGGRHGDLDNIDHRMVQDKIWFQVKETKATSASKQDRIEQRLVGPFHAGIIHFPKTHYYKSLFDGKSCDFIQLYRLEFMQFPFTEHDDILDCHAQMFEEQVTLGEKKEKIKGDDAFEWWRQLTIQNRCPRRNRFIFGGKKSKVFGVPSTKSLV